MNSPAVEISELEYRYGDRLALDRLSLTVQPSEIFALLGPNGGGKTTLFRLLSTLIPLQRRGSIRVLGLNPHTQADSIRRQIGVVFQAPSLDKKLTVAENVRHQGRLYGLSGKMLELRSTEMLDRLGLLDRANERTETLSGGLRRRVELAKGMLHWPRLLLLDEPSTGLDPAARSDLWKYLEEIRTQHGVTVLLTTHLLEEADKADRLAIISAGKLVALGTPAELRSTVGGDTISIQSTHSSHLSEKISARFAVPVSVVDGQIRLEQPDGHTWIPRLFEAFPGEITALTLGKPTLEDVFIARTGHRFSQSGEMDDASEGRK